MEMSPKLKCLHLRDHGTIIFVETIVKCLTFIIE